MSDKHYNFSKATANALQDYWLENGSKERFAHLVRHVSRGFRRSLEYRLAEHDLSFGHWIFLRILWSEDGLSQRDLSIRVGVMEPTTHTAISKMEKLGLIEKRVGEKSKRRKLVYLSSKGKLLEQKLVPLAKSVNELAVNGMLQDDVETARNVLLTMIENLAKDERSHLDRGLKIAPLRPKN